ncbi:MAG: helicase C-terminal domain-containing protein [Verrucomicrobiota bacterium]
MIAPRSNWGDLEERIREMFGPKGLLSRRPEFQYREPQQLMACRVARALEQDNHALVEAGTGVGKSLAYLLPAITFAHEQSKKALVSTHTINLQEQLFYKDIPLVKDFVPFEFGAALLKGRQNYICPKRLAKAKVSSDELFVSSEVAELNRIYEWFQKTKDGTLSDFSVQPEAKVWAQVCSEPHICTSRSCGDDAKCFYQQARKRILNAQVVVMNHHLFFTYLGGIDDETHSREGYLFPNDFVIFDEAHNVEATAARHIGLSVSSGQFRYLLQRLYHPRTRKGLLPAVRQSALEKMVVESLDQVDLFFGQLENACEFGRRTQGNEFRVREADIVDDSLSLPLMRLREKLLDVSADLDDREMQAELKDCARRLVDLRSSVSDFLSQKNESYVYWVERTGRGLANFQMQAAPVDLAETLRQLLFRPEHASIMTSATLSVGSEMKYFQKRLGAEDAETLQVDSPFNYEEQMSVYVPRRLPEPKNKEAYEEALSRWVAHFIDKTGGKAFVLFTSYISMSRIAEHLRAWFAEKQIKLLVQGAGKSREKMVQEFKEDVNSVLFGTDSFWQGIDVPGEALSNVIITRLPFAVPNHPLIEAKMEFIESQGGNPFQEYSLPEAILKFRQGVGRLIRSVHDSGIVCILDTRVLSKSYGRYFMTKLPKCPVHILDEEPMQVIG